jgi:hypothetical protein
LAIYATGYSRLIGEVKAGIAEHRDAARIIACREGG